MRASLDDCWLATQDPAQHQRWDARFTRIHYLPFNGGQQLLARPAGPLLVPAPQAFEYATRVLPGLTISGTGISAGERVRPDGTRISVLRFASTHPLSLIRNGSGWWRYVPTADGLRFFTGYDYTPGWGRLGPAADRVFRPLMGWATAWSFDRLRIWLDHGVPPERTLLIALAEVAVRLLAVVLAALVGGLLPLLAVGAAGLLIPPSPVTPAARRCLRRPPDRRAATAPAALTTLEMP